MGDAKRLRQLEDENRRLKHMVADQALDIQALKAGRPEKMVKPTAFREAVGYLQTEFEMSQRRACKVLGYCRASVQYRSPGLLRSPAAYGRESSGASGPSPQKSAPARSGQAGEASCTTVAPGATNRGSPATEDPSCPVPPW